MALPIKIFSYQAQLADSLKAEYPGKVFVNIPVEALRNVPAPAAGKFLKWNNQGTALENADGTVRAPSVAVTVVTDFPGGPADGDVVILTMRQGNNNPGVYQYNSGTGSWVRIVAQVSVPVFPSGSQLPAQVSGQFILTDTHNANTPGLYVADNGVWKQVASDYDDQAVRALITALTGRVGTLEGENPITGLVIAGSVLTITFKDNTRQDLNLPQAGTSEPSTPATETLNFGLTTAIQAVRADNTAGQNLAKTAAETAFNNNNANQDNVAAQGLRSSRVANPLSSGSFVSFNAPAAPANRYYNAWIAVPEANFTALRVLVASGDSSGEDDTDSWIETDNSPVIINQVNYKLFVRTTEIKNSESLDFIFQVYR